MKERALARYNKFYRINTFGQTNAADAAHTDAPLHLTKLAGVIKGIDKAKAGQGGGSAVPKSVRLDALRIEVQNITRTASACAHDDPDFAVLFRPPEAPNPGALITATDAILGHLIAEPEDDAATKAAKAARVAKFVSKGLPADFATQLASDLEGIDDAKTTEANADNESVENTAAIDVLIAEGMKECDYLDAIYHNIYTRNPEKLRAWLSASHLERVPHRKKDPEQPTPPPSPTP